MCGSAPSFCTGAYARRATCSRRVTMVFGLPGDTIDGFYQEAGLRAVGLM